MSERIILYHSINGDRHDDIKFRITTLFIEKLMQFESGEFFSAYQLFGVGYVVEYRVLQILKRLEVFLWPQESNNHCPELKSR